MEESVHAAKQNFVFQGRSPAVFSRSRFVLADEELAGSARSEQFDSDEDSSNHYGMKAVHSYGVDQMQIRQRLPARPAEGNVSADFPHRPARFDSSHYISSRQKLMLKAYLRLRENSYVVQPTQRSLRQGEPAICEQVLSLSHGALLIRTVEQVSDNPTLSESFPFGILPNTDTFADPQWRSLDCRRYDLARLRRTMGIASRNSGRPFEPFRRDRESGTHRQSCGRMTGRARIVFFRTPVAWFCQQ
jgi:hypothetical protein